jgi:hypothetical protein
MQHTRDIIYFYFFNRTHKLHNHITFQIFNHTQNDFNPRHTFTQNHFFFSTSRYKVLLNRKMNYFNYLNFINSFHQPHKKKQLVLRWYLKNIANFKREITKHINNIDKKISWQQHTKRKHISKVKNNNNNISDYNNSSTVYINSF